MLAGESKRMQAEPTWPGGAWSNQLILTRGQVRSVDSAAIRQLGISGLLLMENAARGVVEVLLAQRPVGRVQILCGPGNNGGDGLAVARQLAAVGLTPQVSLLRGGRSLSADAEANLSFLTRAGLPPAEPDPASLIAQLPELTSADWIVDALLGTGTRGTLQSPLSEVIHAANQSAARILAVDLPSGLDCDLGTPLGVCMRAHCTVTFVGRKLGFQQPGARHWTGDVYVRPIGIPEIWLQQFLSQ